MFVFVIFMEDEKRDKKSSPSVFPACPAGKARAGQGRAGQIRAGQNTAVLGRTEEDTAGQGKTEQGRAE